MKTILFKVGLSLQRILEFGTFFNKVKQSWVVLRESDSQSGDGIYYWDFCFAISTIVAEITLASSLSSFIFRLTLIVTEA